MAFSEEQRTHVAKQLQSHDRNSGIRQIGLRECTPLELLIERGVFGSDIMSSGIYLAQFLHEHQELYARKHVLDMGCGAGTQGIVMAKYGAETVVLSDINRRAVANTQKNIEQLAMKNAEVVESDLFASLPQGRTYDVIVFNHPFFSGEPQEIKGDDKMLVKSMLGGTELIKRFFSGVSGYMRKNGIIIMPYFHFAGPENDPANHLKSYNLNCAFEKQIKSEQGLQQGDFSVYVISKEIPELVRVHAFADFLDMQIRKEGTQIRAEPKPELPKRRNASEEEIRKYCGRMHLLGLLAGEVIGYAKAWGRLADYFPEMRERK